MNKLALARASEIRLIRRGDIRFSSDHVRILSANYFWPIAQHMPICDEARPGCGESSRVLYRDLDL